MSVFLCVPTIPMVHFVGKHQPGMPVYFCVHNSNKKSLKSSKCGRLHSYRVVVEVLLNTLIDIIKRDYRCGSDGQEKQRNPKLWIKRTGNWRMAIIGAVVVGREREWQQMPKQKHLMDG